MHTKILSSLIMLGLLAMFASSASAQQPAGQIQAARVRGEVSVADKATMMFGPLTDGAAITQGSIVRTGKASSVVLVFSNGASLSLGTDSVLDIEQFTQDPFKSAFDAATATKEPTTSTTRLHLTRGDLTGKVAKLNTGKGSSFNVETPVGAAGIRGTIFRIVYIPDGNGHATFKLTTLEGRVMVTLATGTVNATPVEVTSGKEVTAEVRVSASGAVSIILPGGGSTPVATTASSSSLAAVVSDSQVIAQAVANIVIPPPPPPPTSNPPPGTGTTTDTTTTTTVNTSIVSPSS